jgi:GntR family transcriptional regulator, transcriptional repressor for pyruvate dehydrogenase complex
MTGQVATERVNLTEHTTRRLLDMIGASGLRPGEPFATEAALERKLKVSRPILREAISRLRALGFLRSRQYVGLIIAKPDPVSLFEHALETFVLDDVDLKQLAELRYTLEVGVVELAVQRATKRQVDRLRRLAEEYAQSVTERGSTRSQDDIELDFHATILEATHNAMLVHMSHVLTAFFSRGQRELSNWGKLSLDKKSVREHRQIAQAFEDRNADRARAGLARHLSNLLAPDGALWRAARNGAVVPAGPGQPRERSQRRRRRRKP